MPSVVEDGLGITHIEVLSRKLATHLVKKIPQENLFPIGHVPTDSEEFEKRGMIIDLLSVEIEAIVYNHHEGIAEYLGSKISFNKLFKPVSIKKGHEDTHVLPSTVTEFLMDVLHNWRHIV